jgi:hypothetical protein
MRFSPVSRPWNPSISKGDEFLDFQHFIREEIEQLRRVLHSSGGDPCIALDKVEVELLFEFPSVSDDEDWDGDDSFSISGPKIITHPLKRPVALFLIDAVSEGAHNASIELYQSEQFQAADAFRRQFFLAVDSMRSDGLMIQFTEVGIIFSASKPMIAKHYQRAQTERQKVRRRVYVDEMIWQHLREFAFQSFQEHCPLRTKDVLAFLAQYLMCAFSQIHCAGRFGRIASSG